MTDAADRGAAAAHAALRAALRARRQDGAVRRLRDAGAVSGRHHRRASAHPRPGRAVRRLAYGPGAARAAPTRPRALETLVPGDIAGLGAGRMRYTLLLNERGGILDDLMVTQRRATGCCSSSTPRARRPTSRICARISAGGVDRAARRSRAAGAAGAGGGRGAGAASRRASRGMPFMSGGRGDDRRRAVLRHALRLYRRGRVRDFGAGRATPRASPSGCSPSPRSRRSGSARATRCGSRPGSASTATTSTRPRRRSRPISPGRSASAAAPRAAFPAPRSILRQLRRGRRARKRVGIRPDGRAPAREGTAIVDAAGSAIGTRHQRRLRPVASAAPVAMGYVDAAACRARHARCSSSCAACRGRRASRRCRSFRTAITAAEPAGGIR